MLSPSAGVTVSWVLREPPLEPAGCSAFEGAAIRLAERLLEIHSSDSARIERLSGVATPEALFVLGAAEDLPWCDGVAYVGRDPEAPALLLPTTHRPSVHPALLQQALLRAGGGATRLLVRAVPPSIFPVDRAAPIARSLIERWLTTARSKR
ncbi:MAG: hypothetical protein U0165_02205 [Polyangiaceae bacterium]